MLVILYTTKIDENVNPLIKEYRINIVLHVVGFIFLILADNAITNTNSNIEKKIYVPVEKTAYFH